MCTLSAAPVLAQSDGNHQPKVTAARSTPELTRVDIVIYMLTARASLRNITHGPWPWQGRFQRDRMNELLEMERDRLSEVCW
jgi:hypothetical protein